MICNIPTDLCEMCDDANRMTNDGCNDECKIEKLYACRDGCSGPLCDTQDGCGEVLIGKMPQVHI